VPAVKAVIDTNIWVFFIGGVIMLKTLELPKVEYITSTEGKPKSVVLSLEDWKRITETLKIMSNHYCPNVN